jgi:hypothetical protein
MTVRVIALESCSATHWLSVSRKRSRSFTELLHEDPQLQLGVGLNFTHSRQRLSIQVNQVRSGLRPPPDGPVGPPLIFALYQQDYKDSEWQEMTEMK